MAQPATDVSIMALGLGPAILWSRLTWLILIAQPQSC